MLPDRVVAYCKGAIKGVNLFTLGQIAERANNVKGVTAQWLRPDDSDKPFRVEWAEVLNKHFKDLPGGFTTKYHFFEFRSGYVTYRHLATTDDKDAFTIKLVDSLKGLRTKLLIELFGRCDTSDLCFKDVLLPLHPGKSLKLTKLKSLAKKYFSIPQKFLKYYPEVPVDEKKKKNKGVKRERGSDGVTAPKAKRRVGRPKKAPVKIPGLQSVTKFFRPLNNNRSNVE